MIAYDFGALSTAASFFNENACFSFPKNGVTLTFSKPIFLGPLSSIFLINGATHSFFVGAALIVAFARYVSCGIVAGSSYRTNTLLFKSVFQSFLYFSDDLKIKVHEVRPSDKPQSFELSASEKRTYLFDLHKLLEVLAFSDQLEPVLGPERQKLPT